MILQRVKKRLFLRVFHTKVHTGYSLQLPIPQHQHRSFLHSRFKFYNANSHQYLLKYRHKYRHVTRAEKEGFTKFLS